MQFGKLLIPSLLTFAAGCSSTVDPAPVPNAAVRVVNGSLVPVDALVDGFVVGTVQPGAFSPPLGLVSGTRTVSVRTSATGMISFSLTIAAGDTVRLAATRSAGGGFAASVLGDSGAVPAPGAGKVRVIHMAPNAGTLQIYRIQPDFPGKVPFVFPFTYLTNSGFVQSTPGTWQVRVWATPADSTGWSAALDALSVPVAANVIRTVVVLDKAGGGVTLQLLY
jgi:hypothetical protein